MIYLVLSQPMPGAVASCTYSRGLRAALLGRLRTYVLDHPGPTVYHDGSSRTIITYPAQNFGGSTIVSPSGPAMACDSGSISAEFVSGLLCGSIHSYCATEIRMVWSRCGDSCVTRSCGGGGGSSIGAQQSSDIV